MPTVIYRVVTNILAGTGEMSMLFFVKRDQNCRRNKQMRHDAVSFNLLVNIMYYLVKQ